MYTQTKFGNHRILLYFVYDRIDELHHEKTRFLLMLYKRCRSAVQ